MSYVNTLTPNAKKRTQDIINERLLLDDFPFLRSNNLNETSRCMSEVFSPHRLQLLGRPDKFSVKHNQIQLRDVSVNTLSYGAEIFIDSGQRGDFYMVQLPLSGTANIHIGSKACTMDLNTLSVLQPRAHSHMHWSEDCSMILLKFPREVVHNRLGLCEDDTNSRFALARSRQDIEVAIWWQVTMDMINNLDHYAQQWKQYPAANAALEEFLISVFSSLLHIPQASEVQTHKDNRYLRLAKEFINANLDKAIHLDEIANYACVCPRTIEVTFKRHEGCTPLAYARSQRLLKVHQELQQHSNYSSQSSRITHIALKYGFVHMGRFAAQYREKFGCNPSQTVKKLV